MSEIDMALRAKFEAEQELYEINRRLEANADEFLIKAKLTILRGGSFEEASEYYQRSIQSWASERNVRAYAGFLTRHGRHDEAAPLYDRLRNEFPGGNAISLAIATGGTVT